jgi:hypothetical protein
LQLLQAAWIFAEPNYSGQIVQFMTALQQQLLEGIKGGVKWAALSTFYAKVFRRVDQNGATEAPNLRWANDPTLQWVVDFNQAKASAAALSEAAELIASMQAKVDKADATAKAAKEAAESAKKANKKPNGKGNGPPQGGGKQTAAEKKAAKLAKTGDGSPAKVGAPVTADEKKALFVEKCKALTEELGKKDGKPPCFFHHKGPSGCKYSAGECKLGYH